MFRKILIANRGEIACRIARTCRRMGMGVATVHSEADRDALHVREIGDSIELAALPAAQSYLAIDEIVAAARRAGADAVHPGYGFLAENPAFAAALAAAGIAFIGPGPEILARLGDKAAAKAEARAAGVPVVPGTEQPSDSVAEIMAAVKGMRLPVLLKAAAGGGGKGMRIAATRKGLRADVEAAMREGRGAFGDPRLIVEAYLPEARHIEVQILGDGQGNVIHLLDRECSLQRRYQKVIEEAPVASLPPALRKSILDHAVRLGQATHYCGLGTVEFLVKGRRAYFLEVNPRIQVEHPVTEEITGFDLVELQIRAVAEGRLPIAQAEVAAKGFAVEARLYAEDPANCFLPSTGILEVLHLPQGLRVDAGVDAGMVITPYYDPMIAKLVAWGADREGAYRRLEVALDATIVLGVTTNLPFLKTLAGDAAVRANHVHTGTIDGMLAAPAATTQATEDAAIAAALWLRACRIGAGNDVWGGWSGLTGWRLGERSGARACAPAVRLRAKDAAYEVRFGAMTAPDAIPVSIGEETWDVRLSPVRPDGTATISLDGRALTIVPTAAEEHTGFSHAGRMVRFAAEAYLSGHLLVPGAGGDGRVRAPMMGRIVSVDVASGQRVAAGERLALMESMKMELALNAPIAGTVAAVDCGVNGTVARDQIVFVIAAA